MIFNTVENNSKVTLTTGDNKTPKKFTKEGKSMISNSIEDIVFENISYHGRMYQRKAIYMGLQ